MHTEVIRTEEAWESLADEWNALLAGSINDVPFLRYEYLRAWWSHRGGGEWPSAELYIIIGRDENGTLLGIAPLFFAQGRDGQPACLLLGSVEISDYLDLIVAPQNLEPFLEQVLGHLTGESVPQWDSLDWYNLLEDSPTLKALEELAARYGLVFRQEVYQPSPYIQLPRDLDAYLNRLDKKYRHEFRRKMRNAAGFFLPVSWYVVEEETALDAALDEFASLMRQQGNKDNFLTAEMVPQMNDIARTFFKSGMLQLSFLKVGNDYAAAYFNIDYNNRIWVYNSGLNRKYDQLSPGIVLAGHLLIDAIAKGREMFDMMRGDEDYTYQLGGRDRYVRRAVLQRA